MSRPLRTSLPENPKTQGERIRFARLSAELSQAQLAQAIALHGGRKASKSLISQWESDAVKNPENANLFAIQAATGFHAEWISSGKGQKRAALRALGEVQGLNREHLRRAIDAAVAALNLNPKIVLPLADAMGRLYDTLIDAPELDDATLKIIAQALTRP